MPWILAPIYDRFLESAEVACLRAWRREVLSHSVGDVLEIGSGTGANIGFYPDSAHRVVFSEPDPWMRTRLEKRLEDAGRKQDTVSPYGVDDLPFEAHTFDTVVSTLVLCTVPDPAEALASVWRMLKPGGRLLFLEHVYDAKRPKRARWQRFWNPVWKRCMGGCELTRDTAALIETAGFRMKSITQESMRKAPAIVRPTIRGIAVKPG